MNRNLFPLISICLYAMLLAACGGGDASPTATISPQAPPTSTIDPSAEPEYVSPFGTFEQAPIVPTVPGPQPDVTGVDMGARPGGVGTLVAIGTVDPALPPGFDRIILIRTGGPVDENGQSATETIILDRDGTITRNSVASRASSATVAEIGAMVDAINIFAIQANFVGTVPLEGPQPYIYQMQVAKGPNERLITAQDGLMPEALETLVATVLAEGLKIDAP